MIGTLFTHHQKCILVDSQASGNKRKITAFIGGLDLCDGRYDTPSHRLFHDLDTVFQNDFHNPTFAVSFLFFFSEALMLTVTHAASSVSKQTYQLALLRISNV